MSVLPSFPPYYCTSPPLPHERQAEEHLFHEEMLDQAEQNRLLDYLNDVDAPAAAAAAAAAAAPDVAALSSAVQNLAMIEEDDELDNHSCGDSECQGEHVHADYYVDDYECGHRSPDAYANIISPPYIPATPEFD